MAIRTSSPSSSTVNGEVKVRVRKPASNSAREIRDTILRDYFGFTTSDIKELDAQMPNRFIIIPENGSNTEATVEQVRSAPVSPADGLLIIPLNDDWVNNLPKFLEQRIDIALNQSVGAIADSKVQMEVLGDLRNILNSSGSNRIKAIDNLLMRAVGNADVAVALGYLIAQDRFSSNPFLLIARAKIDTENVIWKKGPGYDTLISPLIAQAVKAANESVNGNSSRKFPPPITRAEASYINREAAYMFAQIGKDKDFQQRDWLSRFYGMTDEERAGLNEGDIISIESPAPNPNATPRPRTDAEKKLISVEDLMRNKKKSWEDMDKGRNVNEVNDPRAVNRTELNLNTTETTETKGSTYPHQPKKDAYPRGQNQKMPPPGKVVVHYKTPISPKTDARANRSTGLLELIIRGLNAKIFLDRMNAITQYIAERERLVSIVEGEKKRIVPLKPARLERLLAELRQYGRTTASPSEKQRVLKIIVKLENMREESYAMWK